jgi:outer membrane lipoprotein-sorting protein
MKFIKIWGYLKCPQIFFIFLLFYNIIYSENISFDFYKELYDGTKTEIATGYFYIKIPENANDEKAFYFNITFPVNQIITYNKEQEMIVFYPEENKAFIINEKNKSVDINSMDVTVKKLDLKKLGFKLIDTKKNQKYIYEKWAPNNIAFSVIKEVNLYKNKDGNISKIEYKDKKDNILLSVNCEEFINIKEKQIPLYVETYSAIGGTPLREKIKMSNVKRNIKLPKIINKFEIPRDAEVKKVKL